ncbi:MAG TPA: DinB family protein [Gemmatimonadaceae bacterium]|nr:DinB family protein [Gemmatimonadaceae bacterium]
MTASQMVCHLTDAFRGALGERTGDNPNHRAPLIGRTLVKWIALYAPFPWPHGTPTTPAADQERGGTPPTVFERDVSQLRATSERFVRDLPRIARDRQHFFFGRMTQSQWARWGYRHMNHHLQQFGL